MYPSGRKALLAACGKTCHSWSGPDKDQVPPFLPRGKKISDLPAKQQTTLTPRCPNLPRDGIAVTGVPVGSAEYQCWYLQSAVNGKIAELLRAILLMKDMETRFPILRLSAAQKINVLLRNVVPSVASSAAKELDALVEWVHSGFIKVGQRATEVGLVSPEELKEDPAVAKRQSFLWKVPCIRHASLSERGAPFASARPTSVAHLTLSLIHSSSLLPPWPRPEPDSYPAWEACLRGQSCSTHQRRSPMGLNMQTIRRSSVFLGQYGWHKR